MLRNGGFWWMNGDKDAKTSGDKKWDWSTTECFRCHKLSHQAYECPEPHTVTTKVSKKCKRGWSQEGRANPKCHCHLSCSDKGHGETRQ